MVASPSFSEGEVEPRHSDTDPQSTGVEETATAGTAGAASAAAAEEATSPTDTTGSGVSRRVLGIVLVVALVMLVVGVVASGVIIDPSNITDRASDGGNSGDGDPAGIPSDAFEPPINHTALGAGHANTLESAGSFTVEQRFDLESSDPEIEEYEERSTYQFDLETEQILVSSTFNGIQLDQYQSSTESFNRYESESGDVDFEIGDGELSPDNFVESWVIDEMQHIDLEHEVTDAGHVYTASGDDSVSDEFLQDQSGEIISFEFEAVVTDEGLLSEYYMEISFEENGDVDRLTQEADVQHVGDTIVDEPPWLDQAREEAN